MQRLLDCGVAAADHRDRLAAEEESVAGRAGRDAKAFERVLAVQAEPFGLRSGRQDDGLGCNNAPAIAAYDEWPLTELEPHDILALDASANIFGLSPHLLHEPRALDRLGSWWSWLRVERVREGTPLQVGEPRLE